MLTRIKDVSELRVGKIYRYVSTGFMADSASVSKNAEYDAKVIQMTPHTVTLRMTVDQSTINRMHVWNPMPYNWSIQTRDIKAGIERLFEDA